MMNTLMLFLFPFLLLLVTLPSISNLLFQVIPSKRKSNDDNCTSTAVVCCYIFKGADYRGKFDPVAAKKLGLQPGPLFRTFPPPPPSQRIIHSR